jgi:hypothetical protein
VVLVARTDASRFTENELRRHGWAPGERGLVTPFGEVGAEEFSGDQPNAEQREFIEAKTLHRMAIGGIGSGKGRCEAVIARRHCLFDNPGSWGGVVGYTGPQMSRALIPEILRGFERCCYVKPDGGTIPFVRGGPGQERSTDYIYYRSNEAKRIVVSCRGRIWPPSEIQLDTADVNRLYSYNWGWGVADEVGSWTLAEWQAFIGRCFRPTPLGVYPRMPQISVGTTPEGLNWLADLFEEFGNDPLWTWVKLKTGNAHFQPPEFEENLRRHYGPDLARERLDADFLAVGVGAAFPSWSGDMVLGPDDPRMTVSDDPIVVPIDWGGVNFAQIVGQSRGDRDDGRRNAYILREYRLPGTTKISAYATAFLEDFGCYIFDANGRQIRKVELDGDPQGDHQMGFGVTAMGVWCDVLRAKGVEFSIRLRRRKGKAAPPDPRHRIAVGDSMFGHGQVFISSSCRLLIRDLVNAVYHIDGKRLAKGSDGAASHFADALTYWLYRVSGVDDRKSGAGEMTPGYRKWGTLDGEKRGRYTRVRRPSESM